MFKFAISIKFSSLHNFRIQIMSTRLLLDGLEFDTFGVSEETGTLQLQDQFRLVGTKLFSRIRNEI